MAPRLLPTAHLALHMDRSQACNYQFMYQLKLELGSTRKVQTSIRVARILLHHDCPISPLSGVALHPMVHDPVLASIRTFSEARMACSICFIDRILVEHAAGFMLLPMGWIHGVLRAQFDQGSSLGCQIVRLIM